MKVMDYFGYVITTALVLLSAVLHSFPFAYAAVLSLVVTLSRDAFRAYLDAKTFKSALPEESKRKLHDIEARLVTLEFGIKQSGFFPNIK